MSSICPVCGLPVDICVCSEIDKDQSRISIKLEHRKWGKKVTIISGLSDNKKLSKKLKSLCACGGSHKYNRILLQGDHRERVKLFLLNEGYPEEKIDIT